MRAGRLTRIAAAAWLVLVALVGVVAAETDAPCSRCGRFVKVSDQGEGFDRTWEGLCGACQDPKRRCDEVVKDLEKQLRAMRDRLGYHRVLLGAAQAAAAGTVMEKLAYQVSHGVTPEADVDLLSFSIQTEEGLLADLRRRLDDVKADCAARAARSATPLTDLVIPGWRDVARVLHNEVEALGGAAKLVQSEVKALEGTGGPGAGYGVAGAPIEATTIDELAREAKPLVEGHDGKRPAATSESATSGSGEPPAVSTAELVTPEMVDVEQNLPASPVARDVARWQRHSANGAELARALAKSLAQVDAASAAGDAKRAEAHRERALLLAGKGQRSLREADTSRQAALRRLYEDGKWLEGRAESDHVSPADVLTAWQARIRTEGLPEEYVAGLKAAGLSDADVAKRREWVQSVDVKPLALVHARLMHRVGPSELPDARGSDAEGLPPGDDLWDAIALKLLASRTAPR